MDDYKTDLPRFPKEKDYLIAYVDILGTKERLAEKSVLFEFEKIYVPFLLADQVFSDFEPFNARDMVIKIFSDNVLFAFPLDSSSKDEVLAVYQKMKVVLRCFLSLLAFQGILFRGALEIGKLLINDVMVWGKGLMDIVYLEENISIYPRVIFGETLLKVIDEYKFSGFQYENIFSCIEDFDGCIYFNFFDYEDLEHIEGQLDIAKNNIENRIIAEQNGKNRTKLLQKYFWYKNFVNNVEKTYKDIRLKNSQSTDES